MGTTYSVSVWVGRTFAATEVFEPYKEWKGCEKHPTACKPEMNFCPVCGTAILTRLLYKPQTAFANSLTGAKYSLLVGEEYSLAATEAKLGELHFFSTREYYKDPRGELCIGLPMVQCHIVNNRSGGAPFLSVEEITAAATRVKDLLQALRLNASYIRLYVVPDVG